jgi:cell division protease FtsH
MSDGSRLTTEAHPLSDFVKLEGRGVAVVYTQREWPWTSVVTVWLPLGLVLLLFYYYLRTMNPKSVTDPLMMEFTPERVSGPVELRGLADARARLKQAAEAARDGRPGPRRILVSGPPGTGKTRLLRAAAADSALPLFANAGSQFVEVYVGVGAARVRKLFARAAETQPCIAAIDDVDAFATRRVLPENEGRVDERGSTMLELCNRLDGLAPMPPRVLFLATTNRPDLLDPALVRPGRFDLAIRLQPDGTSTIEELAPAAASAA